MPSFRNEIEDTYKKVNNGEWGWRALRLMSRRSTHFFISGNNPIAKLPEYLESMLGKMAKEMPSVGSKDDTSELMEEGDNIGSSEENGEAGDANGKAGCHFSEICLGTVYRGKKSL